MGAEGDQVEAGATLLVVDTGESADAHASDSGERESADAGENGGE